MKEISYDGPSFDERTLKKKKVRSRGSASAPTVRTFRGDVEELIEKKGTTKTEAVIAEAERREARGESRVLHADGSHLGRLIFLLVLVLAFGIGVGFYVLFGTEGNVTDAPIVKEVPVTEDVLMISLADSPREQVMADLSLSFGKTSLAVGGIRPVHFMTKDEDGAARDATSAEMLAHIALAKVPETLLHSLDETPEYGIAAETDGLTSYLLFTTRSYANSFSGMLEWEGDMAQDLIPSLHPWYARKNILELRERAFKDERILSIDARVLREADGTVLIAYTFVDKKTLIIAGGVDTLRAMILRTKGEGAL